MPNQWERPCRENKCSGLEQGQDRRMNKIRPMSRNKAGRKSPYSEHYTSQARELAAAGCTPKEIQQALKITKSTYYRWLERHSEFRSAIEDGHSAAIPALLDALNRCAIGGKETLTETRKKTYYKVNKEGEQVPYKVVVEEVTRQVYTAPSITALKWILSNRCEEWHMNPDQFKEVAESIPDIALIIGSVEGSPLASSEQEARERAPDLEAMQEGITKEYGE